MASGPVSCPLGMSMDNCTAIDAAAKTDISSLIYDPDTPPPQIDTSVLPPNLQSALQNCDGDGGVSPCKLVMYDFNPNIGTTANSADYLIQLQSGSRTVNNSMVAVLSNVTSNVNTSSLGIPEQNMNLHYSSDFLKLTPPIASGPIGYSSIDAKVDGTGSSVTASTIEGCANQCELQPACGGFNFGEDSSCTLFNIVDKDFTVNTLYGGSSGQEIETLTLTLKTSVTGVVNGQSVTGLETYINGPVSITGTNTTNNQITIKIDKQVVYQVPENTQITISAQRRIDPIVHGYTSNKSRINLIGVNGTMSYGYSGDFTISQLNGLPTNVYSASPSAVSSSAISRLALTFSSLPNPLPAISSATLWLSVSQVISNVVMINNATTCNPALTSVTDACKAVLSFKSVNGNTITFDLPSGGGFIRNAITSTVGIYFTATEFTVNVTSGTPSDRILGWSGTVYLYDFRVNGVSTYSDTTYGISGTVQNPPGINLLYAVGMTGTLGNYTVTDVDQSFGPTSFSAWVTKPAGSAILGINSVGKLGFFPVTVVGFTNSTITFSGPSIIPNIGIPAQTITLSDNNGSTCQDIKACNASIQRLLDNTSIRSFSTLDLVACSACPERAYKKPATTQTESEFDNLRKYLWYGNSGQFKCTTTLPPGASSFDENCKPVCTPSTDQYAVSTDYDSTNNACKITCRSGYQWDGTKCVLCPVVTLDPQTSYTYTNGCAGTCSYTGSVTNMTARSRSSGGSLIACSRECTSGYLPSSDYSVCCTTNTVQHIGTKVSAITSTNCTAVTCVADPPYNVNYASVGATGATCTITCKTVANIPVTINNGTTATVSTSTGLSSELIFPVYWNGTALATVSSAPTSSTTLKTNIGTYTFGNSSVGPGMYISSSGIPSTYVSFSSPAISIIFPVFCQLTSFEYWLSSGSSVTSCVISLYKSTTTLESQQVIYQTISAGTTSATFTTPVYGRLLIVQFTGASGTFAYRIKGKVVQNCMVRCTYSGTAANGGSPVYNQDTKTCSMSCPTGTSASGVGCSSCTAVTPDPGTQISFDSSCLGTCSVASGQPTGTTVYAGATDTCGSSPTTCTRISSAATGTARACHIRACPTNYTRFITSVSTTQLNNGGCCLTPRILNSTGTAINWPLTADNPSGTAASWSYPASGSSSGACILTCNLPNPNSFNMTLTTNDTAKTCTKVCPTVTAGTATTVGTGNIIYSNCNPDCKTTDTNATANPVYDVRANNPVTTGQCTKICKAGYKGDTGATPNRTTTTPGSNPCCSDVGATVNTTVTLSSGGACKSDTNTICSVTTISANINAAVYNAAQAGSTPTCTIQCKSVTLNPSSGAGLSSSYSPDGLCTLTCSSTVTNSAPTKTDASGATAPQCTFACASNHYKPTSAYLCCPEVTQYTGTVPNKSTTDCTFSCGLGSNYPSQLYTSTPSGRSCVLGCTASAYQPTGYSNKCCSIPTLLDGTGYQQAPTAADPCEFTCTSSNSSRTISKTYSSDVGTRSCALGGCTLGYTLVGSTCSQNKLPGYSSYTCGFVQSITLSFLTSFNLARDTAYKRLYDGPSGLVAAGAPHANNDFTYYFANPNRMYYCQAGYSFKYYSDEDRWRCTLDQFLTSSGINIYTDSVTSGLGC